MQLRYSTTDSSQNEFDSLPRIPLILSYRDRSIEVTGLVDSGATVNVLPYDVGLQLGAVWDDEQAIIRLTGYLGNQLAIPLAVRGKVGSFEPVNLVFAWVNSNSISLILGQTNFFLEFDVCFYRSKLEFEINLKSE